MKTYIEKFYSAMNSSIKLNPQNNKLFTKIKIILITYMELVLNSGFKELRLC